MKVHETTGRVRPWEQVRPRRHEGTVVVIGGTYVDRVSILRDTPVPGRTTEIQGTEEVLGGPGLCLALGVRRLGVEVDLVTAVGDCGSSDRARELLRDNGVGLIAEPEHAALDRSDLYVSPSGDRVVYNTHAMSSRASYARLAMPALAGARAVVIGSPTPLWQAEQIIAAADPGTLIVALLHSRQLREVGAGRRTVLDAADVVCMSEGDVGLLGEQRTGSETALVTTMGENGARIRTGRSDVVVPQPDLVETRQTNGAGEAFCAGLTVALSAARDRVATGFDGVCSAVEAGQRYAAEHLRAGGNLAFPEIDLADLVPSGPVPALAG